MKRKRKFTIKLKSIPKDVYRECLLQGMKALLNKTQMEAAMSRAIDIVQRHYGLELSREQRNALLYYTTRNGLHALEDIHNATR